MPSVGFQWTSPESSSSATSRLTRRTTRSPRLSSEAHSALPTSPEAPVTAMFTGGDLRWLFD
jgi:hypothetical protein